MSERAEAHPQDMPWRLKGTGMFVPLTGRDARESKPAKGSRQQHRKKANTAYRAGDNRTIGVFMPLQAAPGSHGQYYMAAAGGSSTSSLQSSEAVLRLSSSGAGSTSYATSDARFHLAPAGFTPLASADSGVDCFKAQLRNPPTKHMVSQQTAGICSIQGCRPGQLIPPQGGPRAPLQLVPSAAGSSLAAPLELHTAPQLSSQHGLWSHCQHPAAPCCMAQSGLSSSCLSINGGAAGRVSSGQPATLTHSHPAGATTSSQFLCMQDNCAGGGPAHMVVLQDTSTQQQQQQQLHHNPAAAEPWLLKPQQVQSVVLLPEQVGTGLIRQGQQDPIMALTGCNLQPKQHQQQQQQPQQMFQVPASVTYARSEGMPAYFVFKPDGI